MARRTAWHDTIVAQTPASGAQVFFSLMTAVNAEEARGLTLIRTLVRVSLLSNTTAGAWGSQIVDMGIGVASRDALAAGALPDPNIATDEPPRGWVYRTRETPIQNGVGTNWVTRVEADIRSARRIDGGDLFFVGNNSVFMGTAFAVEIRGLVRCLFKLP